MKNLSDGKISRSSILKYFFNRYVLFTLIFFLLIGIPATLYFSNLVTQLFIEAYKDSTVSFVESAVETAFDGKQINKPLSGSQLSEFGLVVKELKKHSDFQEINIWAVDGTLVYSSDKNAPVGKKREIKGDFARARNNKRASDIELTGHRELEGGTVKSDVLEVYFPIHGASEGKVTNILEVYAPLTPIQKIVSQARASIGSFFVILFFVVVVIGQTGAVILTRKDESYEIEKNISDTLQDALTIMPTDVPSVVMSYDYHSASDAARVGGDFYDVYTFDENSICFLIGDVSGSGLHAAIVAAEVRNTIRAYSLESDSTAEIVSKTNTLINKISDFSTMITLFFGILNITSSKLKYCNAGHPPVMLKRAEKENRYLSACDMPIGTLPDLAYREEDVRLEKDDVLLFYTDGIIEARRGKDFYGDERLSKLLESAHSNDPKTIVNLIVDDVLKFSERKLSDDAALMVVKFVGRTKTGLRESSVES